MGRSAAYIRCSFVLIPRRRLQGCVVYRPVANFIMADKVLVLVGSNAARSRIHIPANLTFTVEGIKAVLHAKWGIPSDQRCLVHMGDIMNDARCLNTIPNGNDEVLRFWLLPPCVLLQIRLLNGRCFTVESSEDDRVEDVKFTIDYEENIPAREIRLVLAGKELDDMDTIGDVCDTPIHAT